MKHYLMKQTTLLFDETNTTPILGEANKTQLLGIDVMQTTDHSLQPRLDSWFAHGLCTFPETIIRFDFWFAQMVVVDIHY